MCDILALLTILLFINLVTGRIGVFVFCGMLSVLLAHRCLYVSAHVTYLSPSPCVGLCVCRSVWKVYCDKMAEWTRMPFGMVSGVGRGIGVIGRFWGCLPPLTPWFQRPVFEEKCTRRVREKLRLFPYGQYII